MTAILFCALAFCVAVCALGRALHDHFFLHGKVAEFEREISRLQKLLEQRGLLASEIAHEIKNPITAILCSVDTLDLIAGNTLDPTHRFTLGAIKEFGENVLHLITDFLDVSRAESGVLVARPEAVSLRTTIEKVTGLLQANAIKKGVTITFDQVSPSVMVLVDKGHAKQILFNLLHNAIKYSREKGEVSVSVENKPLSPFHTIVVTDNGVGMDDYAVEHAFDPYTRFANGNEAGIGLGLALCRSLVSLAGGTILLESEEGVGTTARCALPATYDEKVATDLSTSDTYVDLPLIGHRLLIVDPDEGIIRSVSSLIRAWGGMVEGVTGAKDALDLLTLSSFDTIMLDEEVQGDLNSELASAADKQGAALIVARRRMSNESSFEGDALESGTAILAKPFNGRGLLSLLLNREKDRIAH